jgi:hypothetical protein
MLGSHESHACACVGKKLFKPTESGILLDVSSADSVALMSPVLSRFLQKVLLAEKKATKNDNKHAHENTIVVNGVFANWWKTVWKASLSKSFPPISTLEGIARPIELVFWRMLRPGRALFGL